MIFLNRKKNSVYRWLILHFCVFCSTNAQELPPIVNYQPSTYSAGNQNWMITQGTDNFIYFANNDGLLQYNGSVWKLYKSPNETIFRSVKAVGNQIYTGCYMQFGQWQKQQDGSLKYSSISNKIKSQIHDDEQFWNIFSYENCIIFQSLERFYIYNLTTKSIKILQPKNNIFKSFQTRDAIYFQTNNGDFFEIENGTSKLVSSQSILGQKKIIAVYQQEQKLILATQNNGFYFLENGVVQVMKTQIDDFLVNNNIYCTTALKNGNIAVGTISNGLYLIDALGNLKHHFSQSKGLTNNTILSLYEDEDNNLWTGLDNGINCINVESAVKNFSDQSGALGTVYASVIFQNKLYVGTNQGLFTKTTNSNSNFELISGTKGQVWSLFEYKNTLFCGHNSGTYVIDNSGARQIYSASGTWKFSAISGQPNLLLQGNYNGISVLEFINNQWTFRNKIENFNYSSKFFELQKNQIFVSHEYKGIYRFSVDENFKNASKIYTYQNPKKGKNVSLIKYNNTILFSSANGIYKLLANNIFQKDNILTTILNKDQFISGKMIADDTGKLWMFSENYIHYFEKHKLSTTLKHSAIPIPSALANTMVGYENISQLNQNQYLLGTSDGYCIIDINNLSFKKYNVSITNADFYEFEQTPKSENLTTEGNLNYKQNNVLIGFTVPEYNKYINTEYQYRLGGYQDNWSDWSSKSSAIFKNLPPGDYIFEVKSKIANVVSDRVATYSFVIKRPWYGSILMKFIYLLLFIIGVFYVNKAYEKYYQKQKQKLIDENNKLLEFKELENEKQLMQLKNEELTNDVDLKNRELAVSTMSLIKKDELLTLIKEDLKKSDQENSNRSIKSVISIITRNINKDDSWQAFKEAFDSTDKDFLKKVKASHPSLTPNDLRLCAYLRLNLTSKEIAPMLNISVRSVEIKRYRLRKKMELTHEQGLVEYILTV